jgi:hypothetical protein
MTYTAKKTLHRDRKRHPRIYLAGYNAYPETCRSKNPYDDGNWTGPQASMASAWDLGWQDHQTAYEATN